MADTTIDADTQTRIQQLIAEGLSQGRTMAEMLAIVDNIGRQQVKSARISARPVIAPTAADADYSALQVYALTPVVTSKDAFIDDFALDVYKAIKGHDLAALLWTLIDLYRAARANMPHIGDMEAKYDAQVAAAAQQGPTQ